MPNRLANATSPYLLQHQDNPVDWYPWGDEAFAKAVDEDKPVFLSVGYSSCHWCHVMEHESFEDEETAKILNNGFIAIKVDREERPDIDEAYMTAVQMTSGRGGWPMSVFLTPDRKPFFAGTYFPKETKGQFASFRTILKQVEDAWRARRGEIQKAAEQLAKGVGEAMTAKAPGTFAKLDPAFVTDCMRGILAEFDNVHGGFGKAPKFPPHASLELLTMAALEPSMSPDVREAALGVVAFTLEKMIEGGIHDHVGGGFHRYSTDQEWILPHFEKMLYDNALMLGNLARAAGIVLPIEPRLAEMFFGAAQGIIEWLVRDMTSPEGLFYSAVDADSEGEEGKFYVWTEAEIRAVLGERSDAFIAAYNIKPQGNFKDEASHQLTGANIPYLSADQGATFEADLKALREARDERVRPALDDKALVSWNGMMIGALAETGVGDLAERAAILILQAEHALGEMPHQISKGIATGPAFLDDYANMADGLIKLAAFKMVLEERGEGFGHPANFWAAQAARLTSEMINRFYDEENGGFYSTSDQHEILFGRSKPVFDQPIPSGNAVAVRTLVALGDEARARKTVELMLGWIQRAPQATEALLSAALPLLSDSEAPDLVVEAAAPAQAIVADVAVMMASRELKANSAGIAEGMVRISVPDGLHVNSSTPPARWLVPTAVQVKPVKAEVKYPQATNDRYEGEIEIPFTVDLGSKGEAEFEVIVSYQACTESECLAATEKRFDCVAFR